MENIAANLKDQAQLMDELELIYFNEDGYRFTQPLADITESGLLFDPETGDDLELVKVRLISSTGRTERIFNLDEITLVYISEDGQLYYQNVSDLPDSGTLIDPETGDDLELLGAQH